MNDEEVTKHGTNPHSQLYILLNQKNIEFIPVIKSTSSMSSLNIVKSLDKSKIAIHINANELSNLKTLIDTYKSFGFNLNSSVLFIDYNFISISPTIDNTIISKLNDLNIWNNFSEIIISSSSFPLDFSKIELNSIGYIRKLEQDLYYNLAPEINFDISKIIFSDYTCINPNQLNDFDYTKNKVFAAIRYTSKENYIVVRGNQLKKGTFDQYITLAENLINLEDYTGKDYSSGDLYIYNVSTREIKSGNPTTWLQAAINHHLTYTVNQLSSSSYF